MATDAIATSRGSSRRSGGRWPTVSSGRRRMETNGGPMHTYVVKCACTFLVQTGNADEARRRALAQVTAVGRDLRRSRGVCPSPQRSSSGRANRQESAIVSERSYGGGDAKIPSHLCPVSVNPFLHGVT